mgnify:CR=1 FL=1
MRFFVKCGAVWSLSFVEPPARDRPEQPDEPAPRHAPRNVGLQDLTPILSLFDEKTSEVLRDMMRNAQDQHGFVHAFALHSGKEIVAETQELSLKSRQTTLDFTAGDKGAQIYKIYCTMMCFGMEHLNDLTIKVG